MFCSLPPKYVLACPGRRAFSEMYVRREFESRGRRRSHVMPTTTQRAERYGRTVRGRTVERRSVKVIVS